MTRKLHLRSYVLIRKINEKRRNMSNKTFARKLTVLIPFIIVIFYLLSNEILSLMSFLPSCTFYSVFHIYCPSCGGTRSATALLQGDIFTALRFNLLPFIGIIIFTLAYIELATYSYGTRVKLLPRSRSFYITLIVLLILYFIIRNFIPFLTP